MRVSCKIVSSDVVGHHAHISVLLWCIVFVDVPPQLCCEKRRCCERRHSACSHARPWSFGGPPAVSRAASPILQRCGRRILPPPLRHTARDEEGDRSTPPPHPTAAADPYPPYPSIATRIATALDSHCSRASRTHGPLSAKQRPPSLPPRTSALECSAPPLHSSSLLSSL